MKDEKLRDIISNFYDQHPGLAQISGRPRLLCGYANEIRRDLITLYGQEVGIREWKALEATIFKAEHPLFARWRRM